MVSNATVTGNTIIGSLYDSVGFSTSTSTVLADNTIINPWRNGIVIAPPFYPAPSGNAAISGNNVSGLQSGNSAYVNNSGGFTATLSGNSWQNGTGEGPFGGTPAAVPGTVQAANYDTGGQGVAYNVTSVNGTGNSYRSDGVDLESCTDSGCGDDLGWTATGQWFRYTVNVAAAGTYTVSIRLASPSGVTDAFRITDAAGNDLSGTENVPATGGWQTWTTVTSTVQLSAGQQTLVVDQDNGGWNIRYLSFASSGSGGGPVALTASPASLSFGNGNVGQTSAAQSVTVSNPGSGSVSISQLAVSGPFAHTSTCGSSLGAGASCTVSVQFQPAATGAASGSLQVTSSAPGSPLTVPLSGTGISASTDLALNRPVTASGNAQSYVPSSAVDGNTSSYWESVNNAFPQWFQVDLGSAVSVSRIVMDLPPLSSWPSRTQTITIQGSTDGTNYTTLAGSAGYTFTSPQNTVTVTFPAATIRYLKLTFTANTGWPAGQLSELQVYSS